MRHRVYGADTGGSFCLNSFDGGINTAEHESAINDNQLSDMLNLFKSNGTVGTRPAFSTSLQSVVKPDEDAKVEIKRTQLTNRKGNSDVFCITATTSNCTYIHLVYLTEDGRIFNAVNDQKFVFYTCCVRIPYYTEPIFALNTFFHETEYYITVKTENNVHIFKSHKGQQTFNMLGDTDMYYPLVVNSGGVSESYYSSFEGTVYEGFNALTPYYRAVYSSYDFNNPFNDYNSEGIPYHKMIYALPAKPPVGSVVKAKHTNTHGITVEHQVTITGDFNNSESAKLDDGLIMKVMNQHVCFYREALPATITQSEYLKDNIEVVAQYDNTVNKKKVLGCNLSCWFGGSSSGISSGTRLFLSGNKECPEQVFFSGLNNPLYFSEKFNFKVGRTSEAVTALGKQNNMLVIFKRDEIYSAIYSYDTSISTDDIVSGRVADLSATVVYFPVTLINSGVGCDCPETLVLCKNKLVWATSNGHIHTLASNDEYSICNVYELSKMIQSRLTKHSREALSNASAITFENCYIISVGDDVFVLDYGSYAFTNVYSYSDQNKAQRNLSWYIWKLQADFNLLGNANGKILTVSENGKGMICFSVSAEGESYDSICNENGEISEREIEVMLATKLFRGSDIRRKIKLSNVCIGVAAKKGSVVNIESFSDDGSVISNDCLLTLQSDKIELYKTAVGGNGGTGFGIKITASGHILIDSISADYKYLRSVR